MTKKEAAEAVRAAKARLGVTWAQLAEGTGRPLAWTTSALLGQQPMTASEAEAAASLLDLGEDAQLAVQLQPTRGALDTAVPVDPTIYRFYEVLQGAIVKTCGSRSFRRRLPEPSGRVARRVCR